MYVSMYVCLYVFMYVCVCVYAVREYVCTYVRISFCLYVIKYVSLFESSMTQCKSADSQARGR